MAIVAQPRRRVATRLRIAIWSAFLLVLVAPLLFERTGRPHYAALLLRPGSWILSRFNPAVANDRAVVLLDFFLYMLVIYLLLRLLSSNRPAE